MEGNNIMILIIDFGSQTAHLIGRRLRDLGVEFEYIQPEDVMSAVSQFSPQGIIFSGGPSSVYGDGAPMIDQKIYSFNIPILAICYGCQLLVRDLGGDVKSGRKEYGPENIQVKNSTEFGLEKSEFQVIMSHGDSVESIPNEFEVIGSTKHVEFAWVIDKKRKFMGTLFHPEADHTEQGSDVLKYFCKELCDVSIQEKQLDPASVISMIKETVGDKKVICAVSGGVDSTVASALLAKAIGDQLIVVYIESGLMRVGTREAVEQIFSKNIPAQLIVVEAQQRFLDILKGQTDPEVKRKAIGKLYVELFDEIASKHLEVAFLGQGTIYSDVIESKGSKNASHIKSHHNVGGLPKDMKLKVIEPVRNFYKDEVREIGKLLGLPEDLIGQHPFPGPGYAIRIRGEVTPERLAQVKIADDIVMHEIKNAGLYDQVFQAFALMSGAMSTAVKGDAREFSEVVAIRAFESKDVMTSQWAHLPYELLQKISSRIVNEVPNVSRVVYDITTKPPATMEWE